MKTLLNYISIIGIFLTILAGWALDPYISLSPVQTSQSSTMMPYSEAWKIALTTSIVGFILYLIFYTTSLFPSGKWFILLSKYSVFVASLLLTAWLLFLTALFSMDPNIFVIAVAVSPLFFLLTEMSTLRLKGEHIHSGIKLNILKSGFASLLCILSGILLITTSILYKKYPEVAEKINLLQGFVAKKLTSASDKYILVDILEGHKFTQLIDCAITPDGSLLVLERGGKVYLVEGESSKLIVDFSQEVGPSPQGESGAYSIMLHKDFSENNMRFFVWSTARNKKTNYNCLWEFDHVFKEPITCWNNRREILKIETKSGSHNSGSLAYDDKGYLLIGIGEMTSGNAPQEPYEKLYGTILRIDPDKRGGNYSMSPTNSLSGEFSRDYFIPKDNPFVNNQIADEVWAYGFRNPFRLSWEQALGGVLVSDVGQWNWEEVNLVKTGENHGWPIWEASDLHRSLEGKSLDKDNYTFPYYAYRHNARRRSVTAAFQYKGSLLEGLTGKVIIADNSSGEIWALDKDNDELKLLSYAHNYNQTGMTKIIESPKGEILICIMGSLGTPNGSVYKLARAGANANKAIATPTIEKKSSKELYQTHCAMCHGDKGEGNGILIAESNIKMANFTSVEWKAITENDYIIDIINKGGAALEKNSVMPGWENVLSEEEILEMSEYLRSMSIDKEK